jgi:hypothetical protein
LENPGVRRTAGKLPPTIRTNANILSQASTIEKNSEGLK